MAGYREHSFDPNAYQELGRPMRPFNWVQWTGVGLEVVGLVLLLAYIAGKLGWLAPFAEANIGFLPMIVGLTLINSRREPGTLITAEQQARNRKTLLVTVAVLLALGAILLAIEFKGA